MNEQEGSRRSHRDQEARRRPYRVLLPLISLDEAGALLPLAEALIEERGGQLVLLHVVTVPEDHLLSEGAVEASRSRQAIQRLLVDRGQVTAQVITMVRVARKAWEGIWETVEQESIDLLLLRWRSGPAPQTAVGDLTDLRLAAPPCDVMTVRPGPELTGPEGWQAVRSILVPVRGGPHAALGLCVAGALAKRLDATITLLHVVDQALHDAEEQLFAALGPALRDLRRLTRSVTVVGDVSEAIVHEAAAHQVVVLGAPTRRVAPDGWRSPVLEAAVSGTDATLIVTKPSRAMPTPPTEAERRLPVGHDRPTAVVVNKWFAENSFRSREFAQLDHLLALKREHNLTISLGLPALNEEKTVGNVIQVIKRALVEEVPLLDEMVLIDSGSEDRTREIAAELGIPVYIHQEILPQHGSHHGKGEALWKSLYVLQGDIVAWVDTDIVNIHPRFVYGILGPLLRQPRIQYVKGFYQRPLKRGDKLIVGGGGRVTELTARPLINLFFPELSGLIQPLAGEYAGRRRVLERIPFFTGYGVEIGQLIDITETFGLRAVGQVDLQERIHRSKPLPALFPMSFAIIQVIIRRLEDRHRIRLLEEVNKTMNVIHYETDRLYLQMEKTQERERPPMITLPEYRRKRGLSLEPAQQEEATVEATGS